MSLVLWKVPFTLVSGIYTAPAVVSLGSNWKIWKGMKYYFLVQKGESLQNLWNHHSLKVIISFVFKLRSAVCLTATVAGMKCRLNTCAAGFDKSDLNPGVLEEIASMRSKKKPKKVRLSLSLVSVSVTVQF